MVRDFYLKKMFGITIYREYPLGVSDKVINDEELLGFKFNHIRERVFQGDFIEETEKFSYELAKMYTEYSINKFSPFKNSVCKIYEPETEEKCLRLIEIFLRFEYTFNSKIINYLIESSFKKHGVDKLPREDRGSLTPFKFFIYIDKLFNMIFLEKLEDFKRSLKNESNFSKFKDDVGEDYINYIMDFFIEYRSDVLEDPDIEFIHEMSKIKGLDVFEIYCLCIGTIENRFSPFFLV